MQDRRERENEKEEQTVKKGKDKPVWSKSILIRLYN
jgi:hypothetical protein